MVLLCSFGWSSITRLYVGELDAQFMAGVDTKIDFGPFYALGDVRTLVRKTVIDEEDKVIGFIPDRTDYKTGVGVVIGETEIEYAHTCYHRVISSNDLKLYANNINPDDTNTITVKLMI